MTMNIKYTKGPNTGRIADIGTGEHREYVATTTVSSRWFKTLKGAQRWMEKQGYKQA